MNTQTINQSTQPAVLINPFPGLRPFEFDESHLFFGRDGQSERLIAKLAATRFLAVVGTSGSGKSSLVRAGLLPALYSGFMPSAGSAWRIAIMRPGNDPLGNLARALNHPDVFGSDDEANRALQIAITEATLRRGSLGLVEAAREQQLPASENLLVVADQFEELFRVEQGTKDAEHENDRAAFVKLLLAATAKPQGQDAQREVNIYVVLTMRSDYLGDCAQFWDLPEAINDGQYLIPRLTREQIREAITGPIFVGGAEATPRLINRLLNDVGDNPDQLPILQHALMRTWNHWQEYGFEDLSPNDDLSKALLNKWTGKQSKRTAIDLEHYEAIGGMAQALSLHADETLDMVGDDQHRVVAERVFKALTEKGPDNREIRRPVTLGALCLIADASEAEVKQVIETFRASGRSFLMPPRETELKAESLIDISHECLMRDWEQLKDWVEVEARSARTYRRLAETAALHLKGEAGLWHDPDLQLALDWKSRETPNKHWAERYDKGYETAIDFLEKCQQQRVADEEQKHRVEAVSKKNAIEYERALERKLQQEDQAEFEHSQFWFRRALLSTITQKKQAEAVQQKSESESTSLKPICFMVMPFGKKPTTTADPKIPGEINFDSLWDRALRPMIEELGYEPIRADQDIGSLIIQEMIERLAYADLVLAEMTILNANVYYEVGVRQAIQREGCVLIAADWARQAFDVDQMRRVTYPLTAGEVTDEMATGIRTALFGQISKRIAGTSAVFQALPGYVTELDPDRAATFKDKAKHLAELQADIRTARRVPKAERAEQAVKMAEQFKDMAGRLPTVALELLNLLKDAAQWQALLGFVGGLPQRISDLPFVQETYALALSKSGQVQKAIEVLEVLIETKGETVERRGLLGGRYKVLSSAATNETDKYQYLCDAIEQYEHGMHLDLNDYYQACNLPRLYRMRGDEGDEEKAREAATVALTACKRAQMINPKDVWIKPTLLGAAFDAGDALKARQLYREMLRDGLGEFQLNSTIPDLERSLALQIGSASYSDLQEVLGDFRKLAE